MCFLYCNMQQIEEDIVIENMQSSLPIHMYTNKIHIHNKIIQNYLMVTKSLVQCKLCNLLIKQPLEFCYKWQWEENESYTLCWFHLQWYKMPLACKLQ